MSFGAFVKSLYLDRDKVAYRPAQTYPVAAPGPAFDIFTITGPVYIITLGSRVTAAAVGATELAVTVNGIATDAAAIAVNGAVGLVFLSSLNVAGTAIQAAAIPETIATQSRMISGIQPAANGVIEATFSVGDSYSGDFFVVYRALSPDAMIIPA